MWKLRMCVFAATGMFALGTGTAALANGNPHSAGNGNGGGSNSSSNSSSEGSSNGQGDSNAGDVWLDSTKNGGPGHEMDPHLGCPTTIYMFGSNLADGSGSYTIDGWPPSGSKRVDYSGTWSYSGTGTQIISTIDVQTLLKQAAANGDTPAAQGYHFKLDFSQDPQKHKVFWIDCGSTSSPTGTSSHSSETTCQSSSSSEQSDERGEGSEEQGRKESEHADHGKHKGERKHGESNESSERESESGECNETSPSTTSGASSASPATTTSPTGSNNTAPSSTTTSGSTVNRSVKARHVKRRARKHARLVRPKRHHTAKRRSVSAVSVAAPAFTG